MLKRGSEVNARARSECHARTRIKEYDQNVVTKVFSFRSSSVAMSEICRTDMI